MLGRQILVVIRLIWWVAWAYILDILPFSNWRFDCEDKAYERCERYNKEFHEVFQSPRLANLTIIEGKECDVLAYQAKITVDHCIVSTLFCYPTSEKATDALRKSLKNLGVTECTPVWDMRVTKAESARRHKNILPTVNST